NVHPRRAAALLLSIVVTAYGSATAAGRLPPQVTSAVGSSTPLGTGPTNIPFWTGITDAASFQRAADARLAHARELLDRMVAAKSARTVDATLRPLDDALLELDAVGAQAGLIQVVHPDEKM